MIRINNIKLNVGYTEKEIEREIQKHLKLTYTPEYRIAKLSIDSRKKENVHYVMTVDVFAENEKMILSKVHNNNIMSTTEQAYQTPAHGTLQMKHRPVIIGSGPAGLFAGLFLAREGYRPILFERGMNVDERTACVAKFWKQEQPLNLNCNVQFGEGGAGTFSDGKLNTGIKDKSGRRTAVLQTFAEFGADASVLYVNKPHVGTDVLRTVVKNIRNEIIRLGGEVHFQSLMTDFEILDEQTTKVYIKDSSKEPEGSVCSYLTDALVLAIGHSARDTFEMLYQKGISMTQKPFAMGLRIEHPRTFINASQYGENPEYQKLLPAADYKLVHQAANGRAVYSFCMCPGGYVVNASSEPGRLCVNGMSYSDRNAENSNSAIVVNVTPDDFSSNHPLAGMYFQRKWEELAYQAGNGSIPVQRFDDFRMNRTTKKLGEIQPSIKGKYVLSNLNCCLPEYIKDAIIDGVLAFDRVIPGFAAKDAVLSGIEARTSSPIRIDRDADYLSGQSSIYPCGEGAGYAGGITSAAVDGMKVFEAIVRRYQPSFQD